MEPEPDKRLECGCHVLPDYIITGIGFRPCRQCCKWPNCLTEEEQWELMEEINHELEYPPRQFRYTMRAYYAPTVKPPKVPHKLAVEVGHNTKAGLDIEIQAAISREDIGSIEWTDNNPSPEPHS